MNNGRSVFSKFVETSKQEKATEQPSPAQKLLDWLQHWNEPTICARDIRIYGPRPRNRESALNAARILVENGFLSPAPTNRYDRHVWVIVRKPIIQPRL
jgi:hypothetical protein